MGNLVGIICSPSWNRVDLSSKIWGGGGALVLGGTPLSLQFQWLCSRPGLLRQIRDLARLFPATLMYLLNNASGACQHTMITEHYANVNWMQIFPKPPACNIIHNGVKIYVTLHLMKHSKYIGLVLPFPSGSPCYLWSANTVLCQG